MVRGPWQGVRLGLTLASRLGFTTALWHFYISTFYLPLLFHRESSLSAEQVMQTHCKHPSKLLALNSTGRGHF